MHQFRLAVAVRCFRQPLMESLKSARNLNVDGVQFDLRNEIVAAELTETGRKQLLHRVSELGLTISGASFPLTRPLTDPMEIDRSVADLRDAMTFAYSLKAKTLCCKVGRIPEDRAGKPRLLLLEILNDLAAHSNRVGTVLCITPTNDSAEDLLALTSEVTAGPIGIDFDPAHFALTGRSSTEALRTLHAVTMHVQLRDGFRGFDGGGQEAVVGSGVIDWMELLAVMGEIDYRGWLTAVRNQGDDRANDIERAVKYTRKLLIGG
ncbi:MAG: sugar phosphate isomerase/epimerase [Planctomycetota bacterium]